MGLSLFTFSPNTKILSSQVNQNFSDINTELFDITEANFNPSAQVPYSYLDLSNSIVDADVATNAGITASKVKGTVANSTEVAGTTDQDSTGSYADMNEMTMQFTDMDIVLVIFSCTVSFYTPNRTTVQFQADRDGAQQIYMGAVYTSGGYDGFSAHAWFTSVPAGTRTFKIQWKDGGTYRATCDAATNGTWEMRRMLGLGFKA